MHSLHPRHDTGCAQQGLLAIVDTDLHQFNEVNLATAVTRMAKMRALAPEAVAQAVQRPAFAHLKAAIGAPVASACLLRLLTFAWSEWVLSTCMACTSLALQRAGRAS